MLEARIIQINRQITRIYVRFIISDEDTERVLVLSKEATAEEIQNKIKEILNELNEVEEKKNEFVTELQDLVITL
jgi:hypothetical protein